MEAPLSPLTAAAAAAEAGSLPGGVPPAELSREASAPTRTSLPSAPDEVRRTHAALMAEREAARAAAAARVTARLWETVVATAAATGTVAVAQDVDAVDAAVFRVPHVTAFRITHTRLTRLPDAFDAATHARVALVSFANNALTELPRSLTALAPALAVLSLNDNALASLPPWLGALAHLSTLHLYNNALRALPEEIGALRGLRALEVAGNRLTTLPAALAQLPVLQVVDVSDNAFVVLPDVLAAVPCLAVLRANGNAISTFPTHLAAKTTLTTLELANNAIDVLPDDIHTAGHLHTLVLAFNHLRTLPPTICALHRLTMLVLDGNPLHRPPLAYVAEVGVAGLQEWAQRAAALLARARHRDVVAQCQAVFAEATARRLLPPHAVRADVQLRAGGLVLPHYAIDWGGMEACDGWRVMAAHWAAARLPVAGEAPPPGGVVGDVHSASGGGTGSVGYSVPPGAAAAAAGAPASPPPHGAEGWLPIVTVQSRPPSASATSAGGTRATPRYHAPPPPPPRLQGVAALASDAARAAALPAGTFWARPLADTRALLEAYTDAVGPVYFPDVSLPPAAAVDATDASGGVAHSLLPRDAGERVAGSRAAVLRARIETRASAWRAQLDAWVADAADAAAARARQDARAVLGTYHIRTKLVAAAVAAVADDEARSRRRRFDGAVVGAYRARLLAVQATHAARRATAARAAAAAVQQLQTQARTVAAAIDAHADALRVYQGETAADGAPPPAAGALTWDPATSPQALEELQRTLASLRRQAASHGLQAELDAIAASEAAAVGALHAAMAATGAAYRPLPPWQRAWYAFLEGGDHAAAVARHTAAASDAFVAQRELAARSLAHATYRKLADLIARWQHTWLRKAFAGWRAHATGATTRRAAATAAAAPLLDAAALLGAPPPPPPPS